MFTLKHKFQSLKADGGDATKVQPSKWNETHDLIMSGPGLIGRTAGGVGTADEIPLSGFQLPPGIMVAYTALTPPAGWLVADGTAVSRTTYSELNAIYNAETYKYGAGNGTTTFNLPDLRGRVPVGIDPTGTRMTNATMSPNGNTLGATGGVQTLAYSVSVSVSGAISGSTFGSIGVVGTCSPNQYGGVENGGGSAFWFGNGNIGTISGNTSGGLGVTGTFSGSGSGSTDTRTNVQPSISVNWIIKVS